MKRSNTDEHLIELERWIVFIIEIVMKYVNFHLSLYNYQIIDELIAVCIIRGSYSIILEILNHTFIKRNKKLFFSCYL